MRRSAGVLVLEESGKGGLVEFSGKLMGSFQSAASVDRYLKDLQTRKHRDKGFGEVVFNTAMTGYQEILTDPSYFGQMVCMTAPHIGNTGINPEDVESRKPWPAGFIVHELSEKASNWRSHQELEDYLIEHEIPGLCQVDTRALTRHLRSRGVVRGIILPASHRHLAMQFLKELPVFENRDMVKEVTTREIYRWRSKESKAPGQFHVVAMDFGIKWNLLRRLEELGCAIDVVPADTSAEQILKMNPQGVFLSNGPGDPSAPQYAVQTVRNLLGKVPIFGVCMGHQILALAMGAKTYKMKFGHHGANQPVLEVATGKVQISSQNHGYAVDSNSFPPSIHLTHFNLNDRSLEGMKIKDKNAFSVQYHPEASPGPHDAQVLFQNFIDLMQQNTSTNACIKNT